MRTSFAITNRLVFTAIALSLLALGCPTKGSSSSGPSETETVSSAPSAGSNRPNEVALGGAPVLIAPLECRSYLGADADAVYVTESGKDDVVVRVAKKDGAITRFDAAGARVTSLVTSPDYVYIAATSSIKRAKIGTTALETFVAKANPEMLALSDGDLYWVDKAAGLFMTPTSKPAPKKIFSAEAAYHLVIAPDTFFIDGAEIDEKTHEQHAFVWVIPRSQSDAEAPKKMPIGLSPQFFAMTVDLADRSVYAIGARKAGNQIRKELFTVGPNGLSRRLFAREPAYVAARGGTMYFSDCASKGGSRIEAFQNGKRSLIVKLPDGECAANFAVDGDALYVPGVRGVSKITLPTK